MDFTDYAFVLLSNQITLGVVFFLFAVFYYFVFYRKLSYNIFDGFTVEMISSAGAALGVYILFVYGSTDKKYLFSFITCELALFGAIYLVRYLFRKERIGVAANAPVIEFTPTQKQKDYMEVFFFIVFCTYIVLQIISIKLVGLVLFSTEEGLSHVNAYNDFGPLFSMLFIMNPIFTVCIFVKRKIFKKFSLFDYGCIALALFSMFTSGSKSSFVTFFSAFAVVDYKFAKLTNTKKAKIPTIFLVLLFVSIIVILSFNNITTLNNDSAISKLFQRIAMSGDSFVLGYDDSAIRFAQRGPSKTAFEYILFPLYGTFAKILLGNTSLTPSIVGLDLYYYAFGIDDAGSNARHDFLSVLFWGPYWGWSLSFLIGLFIGYIRFYLFEKVKANNLFFLIFVCILAAIVPICITDMYLFSSMIFMLLFLFSMFIISTIVLYEVRNMANALLYHYLVNKEAKKQASAINA